MAGVKGRSGGARPGAGAKPRNDVKLAGTEGMQPLDFLLLVQNDESIPADLRIRAATAAAQYVHRKVGEGGKKDDEKQRAQDAAGGKFAALPAPRLVASNG